MSQPTDLHPTDAGYQALAEAIRRRPGPVPRKPKQAPDACWLCLHFDGTDCRILRAVVEDCVFHSERQEERREAIGRGEKVGR